MHIVFLLHTVLDAEDINFIPQAIKKIKNKNSVVEFGSPRIKRDFIYIDDLAEAIVATLKTSKAWDIFQP